MNTDNNHRVKVPAIAADQGAMNAEPENVTGQQVADAVKAAGITRIDHHDCGGCGYMTAYLIENGNLYFDPGCDCGRRVYPEPRSWDSAADWINMQSRPDVRESLMRSFGLIQPDAALSKAEPR